MRQTRDDMDNLVDHKEVGFGYISESMYHMRRQATLSYRVIDAE